MPGPHGGMMGGRGPPFPGDRMHGGHMPGRPDFPRDGRDQPGWGGSTGGSGGDRRREHSVGGSAQPVDGGMPLAGGPRGALPSGQVFMQVMGSNGPVLVPVMQPGIVGGGPGGRRERGGGHSQKRDDECKLPMEERFTLKVSEVPKPLLADTAELRKHFAHFGRIACIVPQTQYNLAYVRFEEHEAAAKALASPQAICNNRFITVSWARKNPEIKPGAGAAEGGASDAKAAGEGGGGAEALAAMDPEKAQRVREVSSKLMLEQLEREKVGIA